MTQLNDEIGKKPSSRFPRWVKILAVCLLIACIAGIVVQFATNTLFIQSGSYSLDKAVLTSKLDANGRPTNDLTTFTPTQRVICWVSTTGADGGIIGMRWYYGDKVIGEKFAKTQNNMISTFIPASDQATLDEGNYHVEILVVSSTLRTLNFTVQKHRPQVVPLQPTPTGHQSIEKIPYVEVPFAFDEVWMIDGTKWRINEVKVVFLDSGDVFVAVVVDTDVKNFNQFTDQQVKDLARPVALYAVQNKYLERARSLEIDGKSYPLDQNLFINLISSDHSGGYRMQFALSELALPSH